MKEPTSFNECVDMVKSKVREINLYKEMTKRASDELITLSNHLCTFAEKTPGLDQKVVESFRLTINEVVNKMNQGMIQ